MPEQTTQGFAGAGRVLEDGSSQRDKVERLVCQSVSVLVSTQKQAEEGTEGHTWSRPGWSREVQTGAKLIKC